MNVGAVRPPHGQLADPVHARDRFRQWASVALSLSLLGVGNPGGRFADPVWLAILPTWLALVLWSFIRSLSTWQRSRRARTGAYPALGVKRERRVGTAQPATGQRLAGITEARVLALLVLLPGLLWCRQNLHERRCVRIAEDLVFATLAAPVPEQPAPDGGPSSPAAGPRVKASSASAFGLPTVRRPRPPAALGRLLEFRGSGFDRPCPPWDIGGYGQMLDVHRTAVFERGTIPVRMLISPRSETSVWWDFQTVGPEVSDFRIESSVGIPEFLGRDRWWVQ